MAYKKKGGILMKPPKYDDLEPIVNGPHPYDPLGWRQEYKFEDTIGRKKL